MMGNLAANGNVMSLVRRSRGAALDRWESAVVGHMQRMAGIGGWELDLLTGALIWTSETYRIHEVTPASYMPKLESAGDFYVAEHVPVIKRAMAQALHRGQPFDLEVEMITGQGRRLWVRVTGQVQQRGDRPRRVFGLIQDITERRRLEREILDIARYDQERTFVGLHEDLAQTLTGVSLMLRSVSKRAPASDPVLSGEIDSVISLVDKMIGTCSSLAMGLASVNVHDVGLITALRNLAAAFGESRGIEVRIRLHDVPEESLGQAAADHLFRIAQGALLLLAEPGDTGRLSIFLGARRGTLILSVAGHGPATGLAESRVGPALGMLRRRAKLLGASLQIGAWAGNGTRIRLSLGAAGSRRS
jgi:signal transduction histidine kinase